jgi:hypothetical protein
VTEEHPARDPLWIESRLIRNAAVKPSTGEVSERSVVEVPLRMAGFERDVEVSLVPRPSMACRMLIGRTALEGVVLVDSAEKHLSRPRRSPEQGELMKRAKSGGVQ